MGMVKYNVYGILVLYCFAKFMIPWNEGEYEEVNVVDRVNGVCGNMFGRKVIKMYQENCRDVVSIVVATTSMAIVVYFGDGIKAVVQCNLIVILLLVQAVYVGIRVYLNCCKTRGYY